MPAGGAAGLHAAGRGDLGPGQPGRGRRQPAGRARRSARPPCSGSRGGLLGLVWTPLGRGRRRRRPGAWPGSSLVARRGAGLADGGGRLGDRAGRRWSLLTAARALAVAVAAPAAAAPPQRPASACCGAAGAWRCWSGRPTPGLAARRLGAGACDVGQGDALVLRAGPRAGGRGRRRPRPGARWTPACDRLEVTAVPLLVLTHFHADHVDGLAGRARRPRGGRGRGDPPADPPDGVALVDARPRGGGLRPAPAPYGVTRTVGDVTLQVLWPPPGLADARAGRRQHRQRRQRGAAGRGRAGCGCCSPATSSREGQAALAAALPGLRGRRAQGAAPRQPLPGPRRSCSRSAPGWRWCRSAPTTTTATRPPTTLDAARRDGRAGAAHRPRRRLVVVVATAARGRHRRAEASVAVRRRPVAGWPHHGSAPRTARRRRPRPGHPGDRQGGVPQRAHRRRGARGGPRPRRRGRALRDAGLRPDPGHAGRDVRAVAVLHDPLRRGPRPGEPPRRVRRRAARLRRRAGRRRRAGAGARRRAQGQRRAHQAAQARRR